MSAHYLIRLEDNRGTVLEEFQDTQGTIDEFLVPFSKKRGGQLQYVDAYGTTTFNGLQTEAILAELEGAASVARSSPASELLVRLKCAATRCSEEPHLFLKIYGD